MPLVPSRAAMASLLVGACIACIACHGTAPVADPSPAPSGPTGSTPQTNPCGYSPSDWCSSPAGDPCGAHADVTSCKADARCHGMPYRGESLVACKDDGRGFASNCPTVGCVSR